MGRTVDDDVYRTIAGALFGIALGALSATLSGTVGAYCLPNENQTEAYIQQSTEIGAIGGSIVGCVMGTIGGFASKPISSSGFFKEYSPIMSGITFGTSVIPMHILNSILACFLGYAILQGFSNEMAMNVAGIFITFLIGAAASAIPVGMVGVGIGIPLITKILQLKENNDVLEQGHTIYNTFK